MPRLLCVLLLLVLPSGQPAVRGGESLPVPADDCRQLYKAMELEGQVDYTGFEQALEGLERIAPQRREIVTLIDFTKPSTQQRLYVLDLTHRKILFCSTVSHGQGSGEKYATSFSNENGSHKSSLGFYLTGETYRGRNGYSLALDGLEPGINDKARQRAIRPLSPPADGWGAAMAARPCPKRSTPRSSTPSKAARCCIFTPKTNDTSPKARYSPPAIRPNADDLFGSGNLTKKPGRKILFGQPFISRRIRPGPALQKLACAITNSPVPPSTL